MISSISECKRGNALIHSEIFGGVSQIFHCLLQVDIKISGKVLLNAYVEVRNRLSKVFFGEVQESENLYLLALDGI